jgi:hypothetical protein
MFVTYNSENYLAPVITGGLKNIDYREVGPLRKISCFYCTFQWKTGKSCPQDPSIERACFWKKEWKSTVAVDLVSNESDTMVTVWFLCGRYLFRYKSQLGIYSKGFFMALFTSSKKYRVTSTKFLTCEGSVSQILCWKFQFSNVCLIYVVSGLFLSSEVCRIWGSHSGSFEEYHLLGYNAV